MTSQPTGLQHIPNLRDAGGLPTSSGSRLREGLLFRSGALDGIGDTGRHLITELSIRTIIDLRTQTERTAAPDDVAGLDIVQRHVPIFDHLDEAPEAAQMEPLYTWVIEDRAAEVARAIAAMIEPGALPAIVHCTAGKDRTGIVVALIQSALDVPDTLVAANYPMTEKLLDDSFKRKFQTLSDRIGLPPQLGPQALQSPASLILATLAGIRRRHGSVRQYLRYAGLSDEQLHQLTTTLTAAV